MVRRLAQRAEAQSSSLFTPLGAVAAASLAISAAAIYLVATRHH
jgi:hypothetical protein